MNLEWTDEQAILRDTVRRFLAKKASISEHVRPLLDDAIGTTDSVWQGLADLGTTGLLVPLEYGGAGMTMVEAGVVLEELGAALHPGPWLSTAVAVPRALARIGAEGKAATLLGSIADGSAIAAVAGLTAPRPLALERDGVVLRGDIPVVRDAAAADVVLVLAEDGDGIGLFALKTTSPGITVTPLQGIDQTRKQFGLRLTDAPAERVGAVSPDAVEALVDDMLVASAADALGAARAVMDMAIEYAKVRTQFGQAIGSFQAVQHLCVDMCETVELARSGVMHALWAADAEERHLAAVRAKAFTGRLATVGDTAIQVFGGIGYTWEHDAHLYFKRLLGCSAFLGGCDRYLEEVGARLALSIHQGALRSRA
jgi:alkylation response protein AidB-like acyl-CoA dehydrogenase